MREIVCRGHPSDALAWQAIQMFLYICRPESQVGAYQTLLACCSTSNRPRATGKILLTTCKAWLGSDRKGNQQRAKVTNTVAATLTNRKSLGEEGRAVKRSLGKSGPGMLQQQRGRQLWTRGAPYLVNQANLHNYLIQLVSLQIWFAENFARPSIMTI